MSGSKTRCPYCRNTVPSAPFCERCGKPLETRVVTAGPTAPPSLPAKVGTKAAVAAPSATPPVAAAESCLDRTVVRPVLSAPVMASPGVPAPAPPKAGAAVVAADARTRCPACNAAVPVGKFCERCGGRLPQDPMSVPAAAPPPAVPAPASASAPLAPPETETKPKIRPLPAPEARPGSAILMPADLEMKLDVSRVFWQGENAPALPFKFELASKGSSLAKIEVEFRVRFAGMEWQERRNIPNLASGVSRLVGQTTRPPAGLFGECTFEWTVSYEKGGRRRIFETDTFHRIYLMTEKAQEVVQNAIQTLNVNISTGHAADVTIGKLLDRYSALSEDKGLSVNDLIDALNRLPPAYLSLKLYEVPPDVGPPPTEWPPPGLPWPPPKEAVVNRLTLQYGERLVHLLSLNEMQLGKNKLCDVKTRLFTDDGQAPRVLNGAISRYHCRIVLEESECRLIDGGKPRPPEVGEYKSSAGGTFVNGTRVPNPGHVVLKPEEEVLLTLAGQNAAGEGVFAMAACFRRCRRLPSGQCARSTSASCGAPNPPCSLELRRQDNVPEAFLNLWGHATLAAAGQELAGFRVWVYEGAFFFRSGSGYRWLVPGQPIVLDGGKKLLVGPYRQFGMDEG